MLKGKLKYIVVGLGVLVVGLSIMRYTPLALGGYNSPYNEGFIREPRGHHRMMWDSSNYRPHRGCMGYFYDDYESYDEFNK